MVCEEKIASGKPWPTQPVTARIFYDNKELVSSWDEVFDTLKRHFGGAKAKDPMTRRAGDLQMMAEGKPVFVTRGEFSNVLSDLPDNSEGMVFILRTDGSSHVFNLAKFAGRPLYWDNQGRSSDIGELFAKVQNVKWYRYK